MGCIVAETSRIGVKGGAVSNAMIWEQGNVVGERWSDMGLKAE